MGRDELRARADELGVKYTATTNAKGLRDKITDAEKRTTAPQEQARAAEQAKVVQEMDAKIPPPVPPAKAVADPASRPNPADPETDTAKILDTWFAEKDDKVQAANSEASRIQDTIRESVGEKKFGKQSKDADVAIQLNIDLRGKADAEIAKYFSKLTPAQQRLVEMSQNLSPEHQAIADAVIKSNAATGVEALDAGVIRNIMDNYSARLWKKETGKRGEPSQPRFSTSTSRGKQRTLSSILEGWANGKTLGVEGASSALSVMQEQVHSAIQDRALIQMGKDVGIFSDKQEGDDWVRLEHPGFAVWKWAGKAEPGAEASGRNTFITEDGSLFEKRSVYAPKKLGKRLNRTLRTSKLNDIWGVKGLTRFNSEVKHTVLTSSFFHHQAFMRSYMLGARTGLKNLSPRQAYKDGLAAIKAYTPEIRDLVRGGLTFGKIQDWGGREAMQEQTRIGKLIDSLPVAGTIKNKLLAFRETQTAFLFNKFGPGLKAQAAILEYRHLLKKNDAKLRTGDVQRHDLAKMVANLVNDDFGGLHLQRMGRTAEAQHLFRLAALAPDWTESNVRSMAKAFQRGQEGQMYRAFWGRIAWKGVVATTMFNLMMAAFDDELEGDTATARFIDQQKKAWKAGNLKWMGADITPIAKMLGSKDGRRKYLSLIGHFRDPVKFISHPVRSAQHKSSIVGRLFMEAMTGQDWAGRNFTTFSELLGIDDKGEYKTTKAGSYRKGEPKGGKLTGKTVRNRRGAAGAVEPSQIPSYLLHEARGMLPIQVQNAMSWATGELDAFDAVLKSMGVLVQTDYGKEEKKPATYKPGSATAPQKSQ